MQYFAVSGSQYKVVPAASTKEKFIHSFWVSSTSGGYAGNPLKENNGPKPALVSENPLTGRIVCFALNTLLPVSNFFSSF